MAEPENLKARLKASYDAIAPAYNAWTGAHSPKRLHYLDELIARLRPAAPGEGTAEEEKEETKKPLRVLELGCGAGVPGTQRLLTALAPVHVTANDLSATQIRLAQANLAGSGDAVTWHEGDMMALALADGSLDAVVGLYSLIHLPRAEQTTLLGRIARWLRPGGLLVANFAAEDMEQVVIDRWLHDQGWMYWSGWGAEGTLERLRASGFTMAVSRIETDEVDASFLWVVAEKTGSQGS